MKSNKGGATKNSPKDKPEMLLIQVAPYILLYTLLMSTRNQNIWIPFADSMTALMLIFLLIVVLMFSIVSQTLQNDVSVTDEKLEEFENTLNELYQELDTAFQDKHDEWGVRVLEDLTVKFENPNILFDRDSAVIKNEFKSILDAFIPTYLSIISKKKYEGEIQEVKIEGHTAAVSSVYDTYIKTVGLSQDRARYILEYILQGQYFTNLTEKEQKKIIFLLSANGFGYGRAIDHIGKFVYNTREPISHSSRRVEFKIVTNSGALVKDLLDKKY